MKKILFIDTVHSILWIELEKEGFQCIEAYSLNKEEVIEQHHDLFGLVIRSRFKVDTEFIGHFKDLKFIARSGSGMENIDVNFAQSKGIHCFNASRS